MLYPFWFLLVVLVSVGLAFECYTCNPRKGQQCIEHKTTCPGNVASCSMAVFGSGQQVRVRKFCTSSGSSLYHYLLLFPGASFCQNTNMVSQPPLSRWSSDSPPAPPSEMTPSLLCVCTTPLCNGGHFAGVVENTMLNYLPRQLLAPPLEEKKVSLNSVRDHPDFGLAKQLADAGF
ncbi:unnamed protein product [Nippostrongylus brasiliensis]|uniref:UPAR/Ly6 domain-containing protein n=1 Tax=Nippostrongylus brasiliensis TaxID=27835 RepID=A0A0N4Y7N9_NIPBR|nr:hypothetical protein Q1695_004579 [Nippostrongylus brasiliensis]VDL75772.1 unnamed protein product [Nippostrongylus brasiliensis]